MPIQQKLYFYDLYSFSSLKWERVARNVTNHHGNPQLKQKWTDYRSETINAVRDNIIPDTDNSRDLGASNKRWANVYTGDLQMNNMGMGGNEVDGTEGHWTMQEGSDSMYLINRLTGKKYKFNLTEVN